MKKALIQMHVAVLLWGFTGVIGKAITLSAPVLVWYRMLLTALFMAVILFYRKEWVPVERKDKWRLIWIGCLMGLHWVAFYGSIKYSSISVALVCLSTASIFTSLLDPFVNKGKHNYREFILSIITIIGVYFIYQFQQLYWKGIILGIIAAVLSSWFVVLNKKIATKYPARTMVFYEMAAGWAMLTLLIPFQVMYMTDVALLPTSADWIWLVVLSLCCTVWSQSLALNALKHISAFTSTLSVNMEPVYGILLAFVFFGEHKDLDAKFYIGMLLILSSVVLQMLFLLRKPRKVSPGYIVEKNGLD